MKSWAKIIIFALLLFLSASISVSADLTIDVYAKNVKYDAQRYFNVTAYWVPHDYDPGCKLS